MEFIATFTSSEGKPVSKAPFYFGSIYLDQIMSFYGSKITNIRNINSFVGAFSCDLIISYPPHEAKTVVAFDDFSIIKVDVPMGLLSDFVSLRLYRDLEDFDDIKDVSFFNYFINEKRVKALWNFTGHDLMLDKDLILEFLERESCN